MENYDVVVVGAGNAGLCAALAARETGARVLDLRAGLDCARAIVAAAAFREESRGAHWRTDFPATSDGWLGSIFVKWPDLAAAPSLEFCPKERTQQPGPAVLTHGETAGMRGTNVGKL